LQQRSQVLAVPVADNSVAAGAVGMFQLLLHNYANPTPSLATYDSQEPG
jgi:hypothetical protein